jgi:hypothetical protein
MVQQWLQRLGLTVERTDTAGDIHKKPGLVPTPSQDNTPRWLGRGTRDTVDEDGVRYPTPMTQAELDAACDWLNNPRGWRRVR